MPELPEVETYVRDLEPLLAGRRITRARVFWPRMVARPALETFKRKIRGSRIESISRRGKYLLINLSGPKCLIIHLRMSGRLYMAGPADPADKHSHVVFELEAGKEFRFRNPRKFGRLYLVDDPETVVGKLGPEPLSDEFTAKKFAEMLKGKKGAVKPLLLNQEFIAGLGNIYVDESLHAAGIHPERPAGSLTKQEAKDLHRSIRKILRQAVKSRGTSFDVFYRDAYGKPGRHQRNLRVYKKHGGACPACGEEIVRITICQRGTHLCPGCQPKKR